MQENRYVLVTALAGAPIYTNGRKYSLRRTAGNWRAFTNRDLNERESLAARAAKQLAQDVRWQPWEKAPIELYDPVAAAAGCPGCKARDSVIRELLAALRQGWIDLKSNKMKHLERIVSEVTR